MSEELAAVTEVAPAAVVETPTAETAVAETPAEEVTAKVYTQEEVDRIAAKIKKNERYRTKKEVEAYYQGRESVAAPKPVEAEAPAANDAPPTRDQFDSYEQFLEAKAEYTGRKAGTEALAKKEKESAARAEREAAEKSVNTFREKTLEKYPSINERLEEIGDLPMYRGVQTAIAESELGPDIMNELVSKPSEFERLMKMSETAAIREIGKLEARLESAQKPAPTEAKKPSSAPAPIKPVIPKAISADDEPSHDKPEAWAAWRNRQVMKRKSGTK